MIEYQKKTEVNKMNETFYTVKQINGDYALLISDEGIENQVAIALLPSGIDEGTRIKSYMFEYEIVE